MEANQGDFTNAGSIGASVGTSEGDTGYIPQMEQVDDNWVEGMQYSTGMSPPAKSSITENAYWDSDRTTYTDPAVEATIKICTGAKKSIVQVMDIANACICFKYSGASATASKTFYVETSAHSIIERLTLRSNSLIIEHINQYNLLVNIITSFVVPAQARVFLHNTQGFSYASAFADAYDDDIGEWEFVSAGTTHHYAYLPIYLGFFQQDKMPPISHISDLDLEIKFADPTAYVLDYTASASATVATFSISLLELRAPVIKFLEPKDVTAFNTMFNSGGIKLNAQSYLTATGTVTASLTDTNIDFSFRRSSLRSCIAVMRAKSLTSTRKQGRFLLNAATSYQYIIGNDMFPRKEVPTVAANRGALMNEILAYFADRSTHSMFPRWTEVIVVAATETAYYESLTVFPVEFSSVNDDGSLVKSGIDTRDTTRMYLNLKSASFTATTPVDIFGCYDLEFLIGTDGLISSSYNGELSEANVRL